MQEKQKLLFLLYNTHCVSPESKKMLSVLIYETLPVHYLFEHDAEN